MKNNNIDVIQGTSFGISVKINTSDGKEYPYNSSDVLRFGVKSNIFDDSFLIKKTADYDEKMKCYVFSFEPEDTLKINPDRYFFDIGLQTANGDYFMIIKKSEFNIHSAITQKE